MPPVNDDLANAANITSSLIGSHSGTTITATEELDEELVLGFCGPGVASVWYKFQASFTGYLIFDASTSTTDHHPYFQLFGAGANSSPGFADLTPDLFGEWPAWGNGTETDAPVQWLITSGDWYVIYAGAYDCPPDNTEGAFAFTLAVATTPPNDLLADAIDITGANFSGTTVGAANDELTAGPLAGIYPHVVWYRLEITESTDILLSLGTPVTDLDPWIDVYLLSSSTEPPNLGSFTALMASADPTSTSTVTLSPGVYYLMVFSSQHVGSFAGTVLGGGSTTSAVPAIATWRWVLADLDSSTITLMDRHARDRSIEYRLNVSTSMTGTVSSDDREINLTHSDGFPMLTEGDRLLYCFRRDYNGIFDDEDQPPWVIRAAGVILQLNDVAGAENADTTFTAFDPWQVLYRRIVVNPNDPDSGNSDTTYTAEPINDIIIDLLENMALFNSPGQPGASAFAFLDWGQTGTFYQGTIETLPAISMTFQKESSIGEAFDNLVARGSVDIVITPIYDPINRPGYVGELSIYGIAGAQQNEAIFAWDKPSRSTVAINRNLDGTNRSNMIRFHVGQGGEVTSTATSPPSIDRFGEYQTSQFFVAVEHEETIADYAEEQLQQYAEHAKSVTIDVTPERCPEPFIEWFLGDNVRVFASNKFRATQSGFQRVVAFTLQISDTALETVTNMEIFIDPDSDIDEGGGSEGGGDDETPPELLAITTPP